MADAECAAHIHLAAVINVQAGGPGIAYGEVVGQIPSRTHTRHRGGSSAAVGVAENAP